MNFKFHQEKDKRMVDMESKQDKPSSIQELADLVKTLCEEQDGAKCESIADKLLDLSQTLLKTSTDTQPNLGDQTQLWNCAVTLWNVAVAKSTGGNIKQQLNAKLRHLACNLAFTSSPSRTNFASLKRLIEMATKTARTWLDSDNASMADQSLDLALEGLSKIKQFLETLGDVMVGEGSAFRQQTRDLTKEEFKIYCCKAEALTHQDLWEPAPEWLEKAKMLLTKIPPEGPYLAMLCYNIACEAMQKNKYEIAVSWLRESLEIGKGRHQIEAKLQARSLRLLATAYVEWDPVQYCQQALNSVGLANAEHNHPFGLHLKIKILLFSDCEDSKLQSAVDELSEHPDLSVDIASETISLLVQHNKLDVACQTCHQLTRRFSISKDVGKLYVLHLNLLVKHTRVQQAKVLLEDCIAGQITLDVDSKRRVHTMLWEEAAKAFEANDDTEALVWYNYSLNLFKSAASGEIVDALNFAKLQRNRASCYLNVKQPDETKSVDNPRKPRMEAYFNWGPYRTGTDWTVRGFHPTLFETGCDIHVQAERAAQEAETYDPDSAFTQYMCFKVALHKGQDNKAMDCIEKLSNVTTDKSNNSQDEILGLMCLAAQLAMKVENHDVGIQSLEKVVELSPDHQQVLTSLRCLIRMRLTGGGEALNTRSDMNAMLSYLQTALRLLSNLGSDGHEINTKQEAVWFMKIAWNLALENSKVSSCTEQFFTLCAKFSNLCEADESSLVRQKTCLLMAAAASLEVAREQPEYEDKKQAWKLALEHTKTCKDILHQIQLSANHSQDGSNSKDPAPILLLLYEYEALAKLGHTAELETLMKQALANPHLEIKTLDTLAALSMEPPAQHAALAKKALHAAVQKHQQHGTIDVMKCSKAIHSLVHLNLGDGDISIAAHLQDAWTQYGVAIKLLESTNKENYPEMEIVWLMTKAWNTGIHLLCADRFDDAERWCGLSMRLLKHLTSLQANYEAKMTNIYTELLAKIETSKLTSNMEE